MAEVLSLQRNIEKLSRAIDPVVISTALFSRELIDHRTWEEARQEGRPHFDRSLSLLGEVLRTTQAHPQVFQQFCEILEQEKVTEGLAAELRDCYEELKNTDSSSKDVERDGTGKRTVKDSKQQKRPADEDHISSQAKKPVPEERLDTPTLKTGSDLKDKFLMDISWDVGEKWEELGVALGLEYKVLHSVVSSVVGKPDHMKAFHMLQEWKKRNAFKATYGALAAALEESGLNSCAHKHCYTNT